MIQSELFFMHDSDRPSENYRRQIHPASDLPIKTNIRMFPIGRYMAGQVYLPLGQTSTQGIMALYEGNPGRLAEVLGQNPSTSSSAS